MARYATFKSSAEGKTRTIERRAIRRSKRSEKPLDTVGLMNEFKRSEDAPTALLARLQRRYGL